MKHVEITLMEDGELSIDGQTKPAGNFDIREFHEIILEEGTITLSIMENRINSYIKNK